MAKTTARKSVTKAKTIAVGELKQNIWAVLDDSGCRLLDVTYEAAQASINVVPGTIITAEAARRIS